MRSKTALRVVRFVPERQSVIDIFMVIGGALVIYLLTNNHVMPPVQTQSVAVAESLPVQ